jgi:protein-tyrosine phosphatase
MLARDLTVRSSGTGAGGHEGPPLPSPAIDRPRILIVCTANQCRSPIAEGLLRAELATRGIEASVDSAGLMPGGMPATTTALEVLAGRGIDLAAHRSRTLGDADVDLGGADLVLAMERRHAQEAALLVPDAKARTFTLVDLVRRAEAADARRPEEDLRAWARRLAAGRTTSDFVGFGDDSIADPIGQPRATYETTAALLDDLLGRFLDRAWPETASKADVEVA